MKTLIAALMVLVILAAAIYVFFPQESITSESTVKKFASYEQLENFVKTNVEGYYGVGFGSFAQTIGGTAPMMQRAVASTATAGAAKQAGEAVPSGEGAASEDYSTTNIQVAGVDEADIVKNDGKYIYVVSGNKLVILEAYPAESAKILSQIEFNGTLQEIFINNDRLIVFGWEYPTETSTEITSEIGIIRPRSYNPQTFVKIYDVTDRTNPVLKRNVSVGGNYYDSRMIGNYVYIIVNENINYYSGGTEPIPLPVIRSNNIVRTISASDIYYFDFPDYSYIFTNIVAVDTQNDAEEVSTKTFLMGYSQNIFVSLYNIYIVFNKQFSMSDFYDKIVDQAILPVVPLNIQNRINEIRNMNISKEGKLQEIGKVFQDYVSSLGPEEGAKVMKIFQEKMEAVQKEIAKEMEKTFIHKISVNNEKIDYKAGGSVPGYTLNQFSMDEFNGIFRIATTTGQWRSESLNHVYILDSNLKITGKLEDLAHGERIYSVRFLGEKGYLVTFRQIDPLFVIDLSNPNNPKVLGYLKIPGVSDYLHPYDETHIIGIGRDASEQGTIKGMKLSLFDVSDVSNPTEVSKYIIGERGTDSPALREHKAFLFNKAKNLLVIPVRLAEGGKWNVWQGAYVFNLDLVNGFELKGKITHSNETYNETEYYRNYDYQSEIRRSLYIDNVLYTLSSKMIKMNDLGNLNEIKKVDLPSEGGYYYWE